MCSCFILGFLFGLLGVSFRGVRLTDQVLGTAGSLGIYGLGLPRLRFRCLRL